jgi:hypothetical protein
MRTRDFVGGNNVFAVTREPMGSRFAPGSGQIVTWVIVWPLVQKGIEVITMLDNVTIAANDPQQFAWAIRFFLKRCARAGITVKDVDQWNLSDAEIIEKGWKEFEGQFVFLGEHYVQHSVRNTDKCVARLQRAHQRMERMHGDDTRNEFTRRNFGALIGLINFMAHTLGIGLERFFSMRRAHSKIASEATSDERWDEPVTLVQTVRADLAAIVGLLTKNQPVHLRQIRPPEKENSYYGCVVIVDASATGWGGIMSEW